jgi:hypothetical protein
METAVYYQVRPVRGNYSFAPDTYSKYHKNGCKYSLEDAREHKAELEARSAACGSKLVVVKVTTTWEEVA